MRASWQYNYHLPHTSSLRSTEVIFHAYGEYASSFTPYQKFIPEKREMKVSSNEEKSERIFTVVAKRQEAESFMKTQNDICTFSFH